MIEGQCPMCSAAIPTATRTGAHAGLTCEITHKNTLTGMGKLLELVPLDPGWPLPVALRLLATKRDMPWYVAPAGELPRVF